MAPAVMFSWLYGAGTLTIDSPFAGVHRGARTRTGGPQNDDDDEADSLRKLMPVLAVVIILANVFGG